jgi:hypothetical protein
MAEKAALTHTKLDDQLVPLLRKSMKVVVVLAGVLFGLQNLDVDVGSLLAGLGIGGIAFALAAKDTVSNFFGSVMIFVDRPFQIGDWIHVDGAEGIVEEVGFRTTRVRAFDDAMLIVPNAPGDGLLYVGRETTAHRVGVGVGSARERRGPNVCLGRSGTWDTGVLQQEPRARCLSRRYPLARGGQSRRAEGHDG